jgi:hypothetical protein
MLNRMDGPTVWYVTPGGLMEIAMIANFMEDCIDVAQTLDARYFITRRKVYSGIACDSWAVYDIKNPEGDLQHTGVVLANRRDMTLIRPCKVFHTETVDGPAMWAIMQGGKS